jgi:hypothetical protein
MSLNTLRFWNALLSQQISMKLPLRLFVPLVVCVTLAIIPASLWAGAITPVAVVVTRSTSIQIPSYSNTTALLLNWTERFGLPALQTTRGLFTYNVGERHLGRLLETASTATTVDGQPPVHQKLDNTGFSYVGRSYGIGMAVGLTDDAIRADSLVTGYSYQERGYISTARCIYNGSSAYFLELGDPKQELKVCVARGLLPNSGNLEEWSRYPGYNTDNIVAIGVATIPQEPRKMLAIAAGSAYLPLNATQCEWTFEPALFTVNVELTGRNITVAPVPGIRVADIEPLGNLTFLANWQFTLISTGQTGLYSSLVGNSFNASIENYATAQVTTRGRMPSTSEAALAGLTNSVTAVMDDVLTGYAGAQLMVENVTQPADVIIRVRALMFGQQVWIVAVTILNLLVLVLVLFEGIRTQGWRRLDQCDYMDPCDLILGMAGASETADGKKISERSSGRFRIHRNGLSLVLRPGGSTAGIEEKNFTDLECQCAD